MREALFTQLNTTQDSVVNFDQREDEIMLMKDNSPNKIAHEQSFEESEKDSLTKNIVIRSTSKVSEKKLNITQTS